MEAFLLILAGVCMLIGIIGSILPGLPGMPLSYVGLWIAQATDRVDFSWQMLLVWGIITVLVQVLDYVIAAWGTKLFDGSKYGAWGSTIGVLVGMFFGAWGIILGPFLGAVLLERAHGEDLSKALSSGWGSCLGMLIGTLIKITCCIWMTISFVQAIW